MLRESHNQQRSGFSIAETIVMLLRGPCLSSLYLTQRANSFRRN
ncbi:hypothetical protein OAE21_02360 [Rubripirellula sp.]|nr:hypothetical protein [Rubripirellula sp.]